jgi:hypothetical protein
MIRTSHEIRDAIRLVDRNVRVVRSRALGIRGEIDKRVAAAAAELLVAHSEPDPDHVGNCTASPFTFARVAVIQELLGLRQVLEILEESPQFAAATQTLDPLFVELAAAEAREAEEAAAAAAARHALADAEEAARLKLEAKIATDPAVKAARAQLEALQAAPAPVIAEPVVELPSDLLDLESDHEALAGDFK